ncbi:aspartate-glutamate racemase family [Wolffia australiana]
MQCSSHAPAVPSPRRRAPRPAAASAARPPPPFSDAARAVGVIGGASVSATVDFLRKLAAAPAAPPVLLSRDPGLFDGGASAAAVESLRRQRIFLEDAGVRCIAMPCQACHTWHADIAAGCSVPFLHLADCVAQRVAAANLRPLEAGRNVRVGILPPAAPSPVPAASSFYLDKLQALGLEVVLPDRATMEHAVVPAAEALQRKDMEGARTLLRIALQVLLVGAANVIVIASDDMRTLLPDEDPDPLWKRCIDPVDALVASSLLSIATDSH